MISDLIAVDYRATSMLQLWPTSTFLAEVKHYSAVANTSIDYESGVVNYRTIWVTFFKNSMKVTFDGAARVDLPFALPVHEMSKILQNKMYVMAHKHPCYK